MAVADAVLDVILADGFLDHVRAMGQLLQDEIKGLIERHPAILDSLGGKGLMLGLKCKVPNTELSAKLIEGGLLTVGAGDNNVRLVPPLIIEAAHVAEAVGIIDHACKQLAA
jgi:acetylornithine/N-succinyldiaminopimelate aminotransferase